MNNSINLLSGVWEPMTNETFILIVEDDPTKLRRVKKEILERTEDKINCVVEDACCYDEAVDKLMSGWYDIAILDLLLPLSKPKKKSKKANASTQNRTTEYTETLINRIQAGDFPSCPIMLGLSAFEEAIIQKKEFFRSNLLQPEHYDPDDSKWAERIANKILALSKTLDITNYRINARKLIDIVILVAKHETEFAPINKTINWVGEKLTSHPLFPNVQLSIGRVEFGTDNIRRVALVCAPEAGMVATSSLSTQLSMVFRPHLFGMLGMCCGFSMGTYQSSLTDVIITEIAACWDDGKYDASFFDINQSEKYKYRPNPIKSSSKITEIADLFVKSEASKLSQKIAKRALHKKAKGLAEIGAEVANIPEIKMGKIVSGASVVSDPEIIKKVIKRAPDAMGLEMEIYGLFGALHYLRTMEIEFFAIKGVADFGKEKVDNRYDPVQEISSTYSYYVFHELVARYFD